MLINLIDRTKWEKTKKRGQPIIVKNAKNGTFGLKKKSFFHLLVENMLLKMYRLHIFLYEFLSLSF